MKMNRYIMGSIDTFGCNLKCTYCFYNQVTGYEHKKQTFRYSIEQMKQAMTTERLGGVCHISLCGDGETLLDYQVVELAKALLENGHVISIVTNGTLSVRLQELCELLTENEKKRCMIVFSLHYLELVRLNKLNEYFSNMRFMHENGFSVRSSLVLCDEYIECIEEIKKVCMENLGFLPRVSVVRDQNDDQKIMTKYDIEEYKKIGREFNSPAFDFSFEMSNKKQNGFCYAGIWTFNLNFSTGIMRQCLGNSMPQNIFENPSEPIQFIPVGNSCKMPWCVCYQFQNYGVIPEESYPDERAMFSEESQKWVSDEIWEYTSGKLTETNRQFTQEEKDMINQAYRNLGLA